MGQDRLPLGEGQTLGLRVAESTTNAGGFGFGGRGQRFGYPPIGASLPLSLFAVRIDDAVEPILAELA
ncbi:MAG: hypothetical protein NVSMB14_17910 [Isosphaeraceae bacterium]